MKVGLGAVMDQGVVCELHLGIDCVNCTGPLLFMKHRQDRRLSLWVRPYCGLSELHLYQKYVKVLARQDT